MAFIENTRVVSIDRLTTPAELKADLPLGEAAAATVARGRETVRALLTGEDRRMLVIAGPCSIHDAAGALEYAGRLKGLSDELGERLLIVMRAYFEKPRTTVGWKGLINDPCLNGTCDVPAGLRRARELLLAIADLGLPAGTEMLDPIVPQYLSDLVSWASIGARTTESQTHREMASGLSMPVGFKNSTDGNPRAAIDAMVSARGAHHFLGIDARGHSSVVNTTGNPDCHIILRGGANCPNYGPVTVMQTEELMRRAGLPERIVVDCSHANSGKRHELQGHVLRDVLEQRLRGNRSILGVMLESNLHPGNQPLAGGPEGLAYGVSITDACIGWDTTEALLREAHARLA